MQERNETASRHLTASVPVAKPEGTVGEARAGLAGRQFDCAEALYLVDPDGRLAGVVPLPELLAAPGDRPLAEIADPEVAASHPDDDQEMVANLAIRQGLSAVPVVDDAGRFLGVVPPLAMIDILRREHLEDISRLAGIRHETAQALEALEAAPIVRMRHRLPWLLVGLAGSVAAAFVVSRFAGTLERNVVLAFFIPGIVYLADAIGTQTEAIVVRGLSMSRTPLRILLAGEFWTGLLIGCVLGAVSLFGVGMVFRDLRLASAIAVTLVAASTVATSVGLAFPWLLHARGKDPAFGSGPLATIVQDVLSLVIYFYVASFFLG